MISNVQLQSIMNPCVRSVGGMEAVREAESASIVKFHFSKQIDPLQSYPTLFLNHTSSRDGHGVAIVNRNVRSTTYRSMKMKNVLLI